MRAWLVHIALLALLAGAASGCSRRVTGAGGAMGAARANPDSLAAEERLRRLERSIDSLAAEAAHADRRLQAGIVTQLDLLRARRDSTAHELDLVRSRGRVGWERARFATDSALGSLDRAVREARSRLHVARDSLR